MITILVVVFIFGVAFGINENGIKHDEDLWNGGHCDVCGGTWEYEQAVGHRSSTTYIYVCDNCGKRIELFEVR